MRECLGETLSREAGCLSDLLLGSPSQWVSRPLLGWREHGSWHWLSRAEVQKRVRRVARWLYSIGIRRGDRVGLLGHNSPEWFVADFAILRLGAVTVPAYYTDPSEAVRYVFADAGCKLALSEPGEQQAKLDAAASPVFPFRGEGVISLLHVSRDAAFDGEIEAEKPQRHELATLIYTSGTTGKPKGVMLTHDNLLSDIASELAVIPIFQEDLFLSFLPLAHAYERNTGQFLPTACGTAIAYAESVGTLMRDVTEVRPTVMISVPRLYEKIYAGVQEQLAKSSSLARMLFARAQALGLEQFELRQKGETLRGGKALALRILDRLVHARLRARLGGRLRLFVSGGAALHPEIARFLLSAGLTVCPGYGLTEASPVLAVNPERRIKPDTVGPPLPGVEVRLSEDGELLARGPMVMRGYWHREEETAAVLDEDGWLHTGDIADIDDDGYIRITDRKKELMVLSNGENVPPAYVERCLAMDPCIAQAMVVGEGRPYVTALVVPDEAQMESVWYREMKRPLPPTWRTDREVQQWLLGRMHRNCRDLPTFMQVKKFTFVGEEWTQDRGMLTPTLKFKRRQILERHKQEIEAMYERNPESRPREGA